MDRRKGRMVALALAVALVLLAGWSGTRGRSEGLKGIKSSGMAGSLHPSETRGSGESQKGVAFGASNGLELWVHSGGLSWPSIVKDQRIMGPVCRAPEGGLIVAMHEESWASESLGGQSFGPCSLWWIDLNDRQRYGAGADWVVPYIESDVPFTEVRDMASSEQAVWVGTDKGMLRVSNRKAELFEPTILPAAPDFMPQFPHGWKDGITRVGVDTDGWVWVSPDLYVFHASRAHTELTAHSLGSANLMDISASPRAQGVWILALKEAGKATVVHLRPTPQPEERGPNARFDPFFYRRDILEGAPELRQQLVGLCSAIHRIFTDGLEQGPELDISRIRMEADPKGRLWVAGQDETGVRIFVCQDNALQEQKGFEKLLRGSRVNDITAGDDGKVYFATDGVGVLVFDGQQWQSHPINEHLPHLLGSNLKPVNYVLPLADGRLCVCTGEYLLIWNEGR
jgi:hypothetical protein